MDWFSAVVVFILTWWVVIFCILPIGLKRDERGLPQNLNLRKKFIYTTFVTAIIWLVIYMAIVSDSISFHDMAVKMTKEDHLE